MFSAHQIDYYHHTAGQLADMIEETTDERVFLTPTQWAESTRFIPASLSPQPGPFSFDDTPYWREVVDCFDPDSPIHFVAVQKGAQVGATVAVLENLIGYSIDYIKTASMIFATVDNDVTKLRLEQNILPMIEHSGLGHLIQSNDVNSRKQGATSKKVEWAGGGVLYPFGAKSPGKMRSFSVPWLLRDEVSGWPLGLKNDGDPMQLTETRTNSFEMTRKILDLSTPLLEGTDTISKRFALGDQRYYHVPCKHCGFEQRLYFQGSANKQQGRLIWETDNGVLVADSVRYVCGNCGACMVNEDKMLIMPEGQWHPTATPSRPDFRSYHVSAMYAPHFARSWEGIARSWVESWDTEKNTARDLEKLQVFYNNDLGEPYAVKVDKLKFHQVSPHRRVEYKMGQVPNEHALHYAGGPVEVITMSVDLQHTWLSVCVMGWAPSADHAGYVAYIVEYFDIKGDIKDPNDPAWAELADIIDNRRYFAGGREYCITKTVIDASELSDLVYDFCGQWGDNVLPLRGRDIPIKGSTLKQFSLQLNATGTEYAAVTVDMYKDRWSQALSKQWSGVDSMPRGHFNAPDDITKAQLTELTVEYKRVERDPDTNKIIRTKWHRPGGSRNELWDLLVYNTAAIEMVALHACADIAGIEALVWPEFWAMAADDPRESESGGLCWDIAPNA